MSAARAWAFAVLATLAGCAAVTPVVQTGPDTYMVASHGTTGYSSGPAEKAKAFDRASAYCRQSGKVI